MSATLFLSPPHYLPTISSSLTNNSNPKIPSKHQNSKPSLSKNQDSKEPNNAIKMPTAPWMMKSHILMQPHEALNPSKPKDNNFNRKNSKNADKALSGKEMRGRRAMGKIMQKVENLMQKSDFEDTQMSFESLLNNIGGVDEDFGGGGGGKRRMPWMKSERFVVGKVRKERVVTKAEAELGRELLGRLRKEAAKMRIWVKVKKAGVTQDVVDEIVKTWRRSELAMVRFDVPLSRNMDRAREILELKTGGLVVWSNKDFHVIYRGSNYQLTQKYSMATQSATFAKNVSPNFSNKKPQNDLKTTEENSFRSTSISMSYKVDEEENQLATSLGSQSVDISLYEREADRLLDGLGPRYIDWWMRKPLPVDADLLPEVVSGYMPPLRLSAPHSRSKLTDDELTYLRKHAYHLPTHFVLGRNRKLKGLADAILKLWDQSLIAKIAVKWGVPNTDHKQMAYELKRLTGGVLILCNKFYIILYRGNDFLPGGVANLVEEREVVVRNCQFHEEVSRLGVVEPISMTDEQLKKTSTTGTLSEFQNIQTEYGGLRKEKHDAELELEAEEERLIRELTLHKRRLFVLKAKIEKSEKQLSKLDSSWRPAEWDADREMMTEEERLCFRKIGLKMSSCLVLGRRGVFDGVIEGLHQHWKHREVVRVITMQKAYSRVMYTAKLLEAESGGIIVSVDKLKEGYAVIIYCGKNYKRPPSLVKGHLLTKKEALSRSLELQRIGSLKYFAHQRQQTISELELKLAELQEKKIIIEEGP